MYVIHDLSSGEDEGRQPSTLLPVVWREVDGEEQAFDLGDMWVELRTALLHYLRYDPTDFTEARCDIAAARLKAFARDAYHVFGASFCTYNLHALCCRLRQQERARGHVAFALEFWIERGVQYVKSDVKYRTTGCPELLFTSGYLATLTLREVKHSAPDKYLTFDEHVPAYFSANKMHNSAYSDAPLDAEAEDGTQLLGTGRKATAEERDLVFRALVATEKYDDMLWLDGVEHWHEPSVQIYIFQRALRCRDEVILSRTYTLARKRESYYFKVHYGQDAEEGVWIGAAYFYARVEVDGKVLRIAICRLHKAWEVESGMFCVDDFTERQGTAEERRNQIGLPEFAKEVSAIDTKMLRCKTRSKASYFLQYSTASRMPCDGLLDG